jgi:glucosamine-6-phosphate deaminase
LKIEVRSSYEEVSRRASRFVASEIVSNPHPVLGLPTGNTPKRLYELLVKYYDEGLISFSDVETFNLDEYYPISGDDPISFRHYMDKRLFSRVNIQEQNVHIFDGEVHQGEIDNHCRNYEEMIRNSGGIDLMVLGIGKNGHIGFNEPGVGFETTSRLVQLEDSTLNRNFDDPSTAPDTALTMGIKTIMNSNRILLIATGEAKAEAVKQSIRGEVRNDYPASVLQLHPEVTFTLDRKAAGKLDLNQSGSQKVEII